MKLMQRVRFPLVAAAVAVMTLSACERPPVDTVQRGYRGTGMELVYNPRSLDEQMQANVPAAEEIPPVSADGPKASQVYENVQVLGDLSVGQFTRVMAAMTEWVAPEQGCNYCHVAGNFASEDIYTKKVSRVMLAMTQRANQDWQAHVAPTGVTCYTCHRGQPVPEYVWTSDPGQPHAPGIASAEQNIASAAAGYSSLPYDALTPFLEQDADIRVISDTALPSGSRKSIKQTEWTYSLMIHMSESLGVNCTHCHNSRSFGVWAESPPQRAQAWHAIRQVREMNNVYIGSTESYLPDNRKGPLGDPLKVGCNTCHQGAYKPMYGARMLDDYPSLQKLTGNAASLHQQASK